MNRTQQRKLVVSEWMTLDGVFDANSMETWFNPYETEDRGRYIKEGIDAADALLFGRVTYEMLAQYWPNLKNNEMGVADRLNSLPKYVVSRTLKRADWNNSTIIADEVAGQVGALKRQPGHDILVFGSGVLVQALLEAKLVDEMRFLIHPVTVGGGKRVFQEGAPTTRLELVDTKRLSSGAIVLCYRPTR
jgi:dihydrofolate reductase